MDIWVAIQRENAEKMVDVLREFGFESDQLTVDLFLTLPLFAKQQLMKKAFQKVIGKVLPTLLLKLSLQAIPILKWHEKVDEWLNAGCAMVWVINPRRETVEVYQVS